MSRSYRKPYFTICGGDASEHNDKKVASRSWRRLINRGLRHADWDSYLIPVRCEAPNNNRYQWGSDGSNQLDTFPDRWDRQRLCYGDIEGYERARHWHEKLTRK
jgi:hypothetical protein